MLDFLHRDNRQGKQHLEYLIWLDVASCASHPIRLWNPLVIMNPGRLPAISQVFFMEIFIKQSQHLGLPLLVGCFQLFLSSNHIAGSFDYQYLGKSEVISQFLLHLQTIIKGGEHLRLPLLLGCCLVCLQANQDQDSLIINIRGRNKSIPLSVYFQSYLFTCIYY